MDSSVRRVDSRITAATVFSDVAHVTRSATARLSGGLERLIFDGLPSGIDPGSIRVRTSRGQLRAIETDVLERKTDAGSSSIALREAVELLEAKAHRLAGEIEALQAEVGLIDRVVPTPAGLHASPLRPDVFLAGLDLLGQRRAATIATLREAQRDAEATARDLADARQRLAHAGPSAGADDKQSVLVVALDAGEGGESTIDLTYEAAWATWRPYYQVRLDRRESTVECARFADLWQETGEDWSRVQLRLSTAEPELGLRLPRVLPWSLGVAKSFEDRLSTLYARHPDPPPAAPQAPVAGRVPIPPPPPATEPIPGKALLARGRRAEAPAPPSPASRSDDGPPTADLALDDTRSTREITREVTPESPPAPSEPLRRRGPPLDHPDFERLGSGLPRDSAGGINFELDVKSPTSARSGRQRHRLSLGSVVYPAKLEYLLRPAITRHAFGRVTVINSESVPLLEGPASVFAGDAFFGETRIRTTPANGNLILDLGAETAIKCARRSRTTIRSEGILTKSDVHLIEIGIDIENHLDQTAELELEDQVPISRDPNVKVRVLQTVPKDARLDELTGVLTFRLRLVAGAKEEISIAYEIEVPPDYRITQTLKAAHR